MVRIKHRYITGQLLSTAASQSKSTRFGTADISNAIKVSIKCSIATACAYELILIILLLKSKEKIGVLFGDVGSGGAAALTKVCFFDSDSGILIIRVSRDFYRKLLLAMACVTHLKGLGIMIRCLKVTSTARTCIKGMKVILNASSSGGDTSVDLDNIKASL